MATAPAPLSPRPADEPSVADADGSVTTAAEGVLEASRRFYCALNHALNGDASRMAAVWRHDDAVTVADLAGGLVVGWEDVRRGWDTLAASASCGRVTVSDLQVQAFGGMAYTVGIEHVRATLRHQRLQPVRYTVCATNVYARAGAGGEWQLVHRHTDATAEAQTVFVPRTLPEAPVPAGGRRRGP